MTHEFGIEEVRGCPNCSGSQWQDLFIGYDDRYGHPDPYPVVECSKCQLAFLSARPLEENVPDLYSRYYPSPSVTSIHKSWKTSLKGRLKKTPLWFAHQNLATPINLYTHIDINKNTAVLDVGSGPAIDTASWVIRNGGSWIGVEANKSICSYLNEHGIPIFNGSLEKFRDNYKEKFDYILLSQIIEHVYHPVEFMKTARELLKDTGRIVLSSPNYESMFRKQYSQKWLHWHIPYHVSQFSRTSLEVLAERAGLKIKKYITVIPSSWFRAQQALLKRGLYQDEDCKSSLPLQVYLNARYSSTNRSGRGDALIVMLGIH